MSVIPQSFEADPAQAPYVLRCPDFRLDDGGMALTPRLIGADEPELAACWRGLEADAAEPNVFLSELFMRASLQHCRNGQKVDLFTLWTGAGENARLAGIMPLASYGRYGQRPVPHVGNWLQYNAFLGSPLIRAGYEHEFWRALLSTLDSAPGTALFLYLRQITRSGPVEAALRHVADEQGRQLSLVRSEERAFLQSDLSPKDYYEATVRGKKRKELRRQQNRLSEMGELSFDRLEGRDRLEPWIEEFLALEAAGWKGGNASALASHDSSREFFLDMMHAAARAHVLERLDLRLDGKPIAMLINLMAPPGSFSFKTAFDEQYARFSPGVLLQIENLDMLNRPDIEWMDSCAAEGHPMIDSLWSGRRELADYTVAIGGAVRRRLYAGFRKIEKSREEARQRAGGEQ